ncbi:MAG TPA: hypothetical protein ENJ75_02820 [Candidatus Kaiserbacteria bacterium]|nr:hypothetical protein [Candidatus Kaiserbacteria bacterium]
MSTFIDKNNSARATTRSGNVYTGVHIASTTHILDISAELSALVNAVHNSDLYVTEMETVQTKNTAPSPLVLKIIADHGARTGVPIHYILRDEYGKIHFETKDANHELGSYIQTNSILKSFGNRFPSTAKILAKDVAQDKLESTLKKYAVDGISRNFPTYDGASGYGSAVRTKNGDIYFGGQYSASDQRLGVHAEMAVLTQAISDGATGFTHIALASSKFKDAPASPCGCCRQFISEASHETNSNPNILLFASNSNSSSAYTIDELLPVQWTNRAS